MVYRWMIKMNSINWNIAHIFYMNGPLPNEKKKNKRIESNVRNIIKNITLCSFNIYTSNKCAHHRWKKERKATHTKKYTSVNLVPIKIAEIFFSSLILNGKRTYVFWYLSYSYHGKYLIQMCSHTDANDFDSVI